MSFQHFCALKSSILGPLLFLLYVNDIVNVSSKVELILFADDTNVFIKGNNIDECIRILNIELSKIHQWLSINKLSLNVQKTSYIVFNSHRSCSVPMENIYIDDVIVNRVYTSMFLGVKLNSKLTWNDHILMIKHKISKNIGIIRKVRHLFHQSTLRSLYFSFINPYITYCIDVWGKSPKVFLNSIHLLQKQCCRLITHSARRAESEPLFKRLNILNVYQVYTYSVALIMFKFHHGLLPDPIKKLFNYKTARNIGTRQRNLLVIPLVKFSYSQNSLQFTGVKIWNKILLTMDVLTSINVFKRNIKNLIIMDNFDV